MTPAAAVRAAIPRDVADLLRALRSAGFGAYVVGGAVRDELLGLPSHVDSAQLVSAGDDQAVAA